MELNEIEKSLNENPNLIDIKDNLMELIKLFNKNFPNVDLSNLNTKLKTLNINKGSKYLIKNSSKYNPVTNEILINLSKENIDYKHILMRELINIITSKDNYTGFNKDNKFMALNTGVTERITNFLVGNEGVQEFENEIIASNLFESLVGSEKFLNFFFNNDTKCFENSIMLNEIEEFNALANMSMGLGLGSLTKLSDITLKIAEKLGKEEDVKRIISEIPSHLEKPSNGLEEFQEQIINQKLKIVENNIKTI